MGKVSNKLRIFLVVWNTIFLTGWTVAFISFVIGAISLTPLTLIFMFLTIILDCLQRLYVDLSELR